MLNEFAGFLKFVVGVLELMFKAYVKECKKWEAEDFQHIKR